MEPQIHACRSVHLIDSWTLSKTVLFGRLRSLGRWKENYGMGAAGMRSYLVSCTRKGLLQRVNNVNTVGTYFDRA
jgi:hypothetical protein